HISPLKFPADFASMRVRAPALAWLNSQFLLRFSENREIRHVVERYFALYFGGFFCFVDDQSESGLRQRPIVIKRPRRAVVVGAGRFTIDFLPVHQELNRS